MRLRLLAGPAVRKLLRWQLQEMRRQLQAAATREAEWAKVVAVQRQQQQRRLDDVRRQHQADVAALKQVGPSSQKPFARA